jgi:NitT/TauT family transport system permease protein
MALARVLIIAAVFLIWWAAGEVHLLNPLIFPSLGDTVHQFDTVFTNGTLISASVFTLQAAAIGFAIGMVSGTLIGFFVGLSSTLTRIFAPFITVLNVLPRIALAPLYVLWFGIGTASGAALVISLVFFTALLNTISGTRAVEPSHITTARLYGAGRWDIIQKVVLPSTVPWIITAGRLSLAHALAGAIVAEMFLGQQGLGFLIAQGSGVFNMGVVFAAIFASLVMAAIVAWLGDLLENHLLRWRVSNIST